MRSISATFLAHGHGLGPGHSLASGLCTVLGQQTRGSQLLTQVPALQAPAGSPGGLDWVRGERRMGPDAQGGQTSWDGPVAPSLLQSIPRSHGPWQCTSLLGEDPGMDVAQIWPLPALPADSLFFPSSGKPTGLTGQKDYPCPTGELTLSPPFPFREVLAITPIVGPPLSPPQATYPTL